MKMHICFHNAVFASTVVSNEDTEGTSSVFFTDVQ